MGPTLAMFLVCQSSPILEWSAPAGCPDFDWVATRIENLTLGETSGDVELSGELSVDAEGGYHLRARLRSPSGHTSRELESRDCTVLAQAFALEAALLIAPEQTLLELSHDDDPAPPQSTDFTREPERPDEDSRDDRGSPRPIAHVRVAPMLGVSTLRPGVDGGLAAAAGIGGARLMAEIVVSTWPLGRIGYVDDMDRRGRADLSALAGGINLCQRSRLGRFDLGACLGADAGFVIARPSGLPDGRRRASATMSGRFGPRIGLHLTPAWMLVLDVPIVVALLRPGFSVQEVGVVWRAPPVGLAPALGVEWRRR
jgi:hypothetical protein